MQNMSSIVERPGNPIAQPFATQSKKRNVPESGIGMSLLFDTRVNELLQEYSEDQVMSRKKPARMSNDNMCFEFHYDETSAEDVYNAANDGTALAGVSGKRKYDDAMRYFGVSIDDLSATDAQPNLGMQASTGGSGGSGANISAILASVGTGLGKSLMSGPNKNTSAANGGGGASDNLAVSAARLRTQHMRNELALKRSAAPIRTVKSIQFGVLSEKEIGSGIHINNVALYERSVPAKGGLYDLRTSAFTGKYDCKTCDEGTENCPGHLGYVELPVPVFHLGFLDRVLKILRCVCFQCRRLLIDPWDPMWEPIFRHTDSALLFKGVLKACKNQKYCRFRDASMDGCLHSGCGFKQPKFKKDNGRIFMTMDSSTPACLIPNNRVDEAIVTYEILRQIPDEDLAKMGMDVKNVRPESLMIKRFPILPPPARPPGVSGKKGGGVVDHDFTQLYKEVVKSVNDLKADSVSQNTQDMVKTWTVVQYNVNVIMDNQSKGQPKAKHRTSGKECMSFRQHIKGKTGLIRQHLMGKRVNFSARSVITGDINIAVGEIGIPYVTARTLTFPEIVTPMNVVELTRMVERGPKEWPGANYVLDGETRIPVELLDHRFVLVPGMKVERHLVDGDIVLFNRQPSLHKQSAMAHRVRVLPHSTFRLNPAACGPYNADFDGDEMNVHAPQSYESRAEMMELMSVDKQFIGLKNSAPCLGIIQDGLIGGRKLTDLDTFLERDEVMQLMMVGDVEDLRLPEPAILLPRPLWTGKQVFGMLLPKNLQLRKACINHNHDLCRVDKWPVPEPRDGFDTRARAAVGDTVCVIVNGELLSGHLDKGTIGASVGSVPHILTMDVNGEEALRFITRAYRVFVHHITQVGFSVHLGDMVGSDKMEVKIDELVDSTKIIVDKQVVSGMNEILINSTLNQVRNAACGIVVQDTKRLNNLRYIIEAGAKGSKDNLVQIQALLGQQNVEGKRMKKTGAMNRTFPHFAENCDSVESRGFVENSLVRGLNPIEFFCHAMGGREGCVDTSVKTAFIGYAEKRLMKTLEDIMCAYDQTVRKADKSVVQYRFADGGGNPEFHEMYHMWYLALSDAAFVQKMQCSVWTGDEVDSLVSLKKQVSECVQKSLMPDPLDFALAFNVKRLVVRAKAMTDDGTADAGQMRMMLENGIREMNRIQPNAIVELILRVEFGPHNLHELATGQLAWIWNRVLFKYHRAQVEPGTMLGARVGQSIAEPATQLTLNTFHSAGIGKQHVTVGVPRLVEIIDASANPKTPLVTIRPHPAIAEDKHKVEALCNLILDTRVDTLLLTSQVVNRDKQPVAPRAELVGQVYDADQLLVYRHQGDEELIQQYCVMPDEDIPGEVLNACSKLYVRLVFSQKMLFERQISLTAVACRIRDTVSNAVCMYMDRHVSLDGGKSVVMLVFLTDGDQGMMNEPCVFRMLETRVKTIRVSGVKGVSRASVNSEIRYKVQHDGKFCKMEENVITVNSSSGMRALGAVVGFDANSLVSNDVIAVYHAFGIEAARQCICKQLTAVLSSDGAYLHPSNIMLLADTMTRLGEVVSTARHGARKSSRNTPIQMCTFEQPVDILLQAAQSGTIDMLQGPSESIMLGQLMKGGTGMCDLIMDIQEVEKSAVHVGITNEIRTLVREADREGTFVVSEIPHQGDVPEELMVEAENQWQDLVMQDADEASGEMTGQVVASQTYLHLREMDLVWEPRWSCVDDRIVEPRWFRIKTDVATEADVPMQDEQLRIGTDVVKECNVPMQDEKTMARWATGRLVQTVGMCNVQGEKDVDVDVREEVKKFEKMQTMKKLDPYSEIRAQDIGAPFLCLGEICERK